MPKEDVKEPGTDLANTIQPGSAPLPAFMADRAKQDAGKGTSQDAADNLVPLIYLLQSGSPQAKKRDPAYMDGAEEGDIWLRNSGLVPEYVKGEEGILFQPCVFQKDWVEWMPNRGGYAGRHDERPAEAKEVEIQGEDGEPKMVWQLPNKNQVVEVRYHIGIVHLASGQQLPYVIPMAGSGHTISRGWMARMNAKSIAGVSGPAPSWACLYRLKAKGKQNAKGQSWVVYDIIDAGWVQSAEDYEAGARLYQSFASGEKAVEVPIDEGAHGGGGSAQADENPAM